MYVSILVPDLYIPCWFNEYPTIGVYWAANFHIQTCTDLEIHGGHSVHSVVLCPGMAVVPVLMPPHKYIHMAAAISRPQPLELLCDVSSVVVMTARFATGTGMCL